MSLLGMLHQVTKLLLPLFHKDEAYPICWGKSDKFYFAMVSHLGLYSPSIKTCLPFVLCFHFWRLYLFGENKLDSLHCSVSLFFWLLLELIIWITYHCSFLLYNTWHPVWLGISLWVCAAHFSSTDTLILLTNTNLDVHSNKWWRKRST